MNEGPAAGQTIAYFLAPWGLQMESHLLSEGHGLRKDIGDQAVVADRSGEVTVGAFVMARALCRHPRLNLEYSVDGRDEARAVAFWYGSYDRPRTRLMIAEKSAPLWPCSAKCS